MALARSYWVRRTLQSVCLRPTRLLAGRPGIFALCADVEPAQNDFVDQELRQRRRIARRQQFAQVIDL
jgi:hypothetical protein